MRLVGRVEVQKVGPAPRCGGRISQPWRSWKSKGPSLTLRLPRPGFQHREEESPQNLAVKSSGDSDCLVRQKAAGNPNVSLKCSHTDALAGTNPRVPQRAGNSGGTRNIQRRTQLCGFRMRTRWTTTIVPVLSPPSVWPTGVSHLAYVKPAPQIARSEFALAW